MAERTSRVRRTVHRRQPLSRVGIATLVTTKGLDLVTTILGLSVVAGLAEQNPIGAIIYREFGIPGLVGVSLVGTVLVILVVEWAVARLQSLGYTDSAYSLYVISYLPLSVLYTIATINNVLLLLATSR